MALIYLLLTDGRQMAIEPETIVRMEATSDAEAARVKAIYDEARAREAAGGFKAYVGADPHGGGCCIFTQKEHTYVRESFAEVKAKIEAARKEEPEGAALASWKRAGDEVFQTARKIGDAASWLPAIGDNIKAITSQHGPVRTTLNAWGRAGDTIRSVAEGLNGRLDDIATALRTKL